MIEYLSGKLISKELGHIVLDCSGIGYGLDVPLPLFYEVGPVGSKASFFVHTYVREDQLRLFGFQNNSYLQAFKVLIGIGGVGPKVALAILSTLTIGLIKEAVEANQPSVFEQVPGIGKRTGEKILVELKGKLSKLPSYHGTEMTNLEGASALASGQENMRVDLISALSNLGFKEKQTQKIVNDVLKENPTSDFTEIVRFALAKLQSNVSGGSSKAPNKQTKDQQATNHKQLNTLF